MSDRHRRGRPARSRATPSSCLRRLRPAGRGDRRPRAAVPLRIFRRPEAGARRRRRPEKFGLLKKLEDFAGRTVEYEFDDERRLKKIKLPEVKIPGRRLPAPTIPSKGPPSPPSATNTARRREWKRHRADQGGAARRFRQAAALGNVPAGVRRRPRRRAAGDLQLRRSKPAGSKRSASRRRTTPTAPVAGWYGRSRLQASANQTGPVESVELVAPVGPPGRNTSSIKAAPSKSSRASRWSRPTAVLARSHGEDYLHTSRTTGASRDGHPSDGGKKQSAPCPDAAGGADARPGGSSDADRPSTLANVLKVGARRRPHGRPRHRRPIRASSSAAGYQEDNCGRHRSPTASPAASSCRFPRPMATSRTAFQAEGIGGEFENDGIWPRSRSFNGGASNPYEVAVEFEADTQEKGKSRPAGTGREGWPDWLWRTARIRLAVQYRTDDHLAGHRRARRLRTPGIARCATSKGWIDRPSALPLGNPECGLAGPRLRAPKGPTMPPAIWPRSAA